MNTYVTEIRAIEPTSGEIKLFAGPHIEAESEAAATAHCQENGLGYCVVVGQLG